MKHVMLDLETMALSARAAILQIGAVLFNPLTGEIGERFHADVALRSCYAAGREVDLDTVLWWLGKEKVYPDDTPEKIGRRRLDKDAARARLVAGQLKAVGIEDALVSFICWLEAHFASPDAVEGLWSHGANFDIPILQDAIINTLGLTDQQLPWGYRAPRDTRTVFWLACGDASGRPFFEAIPLGDEVKHCASSDAYRQAVALCAALAALRQAV